MEKLWYASFVQEPAEKNKMLRSKENPFGFLLGIFISLAVSGAAIPSVIAASPSPTSSGYLSLPAFDAEMIQDHTDSTSLRVGDSLELKVNGIRATDIESPTEHLEDEGWEIQAKPQNEKTPGNDFRFFAVPLKPGNLNLPSLLLKDSNGKQVGRTNPLNVEVKSAISPNDPHPQEPEKSAPPVGLAFPWWIVLAAGILALILLAGLVYGVYRWVKQRKKKLPPVAAEPPLPEDEAALQRLSELEKKGFLNRGEFKAHYFRISEILKLYVGARYRFDAPESTTREIIVFLEDKKSASDAVIDRLESLFNKLDRVKFTDHFPESEEASSLVAEAREFVMVTRRPPMTVQQAGADVHASR
jgi:hypothetical protein